MTPTKVSTRPFSWAMVVTGAADADPARHANSASALSRTINTRRMDSVPPAAGQSFPMSVRARCALDQDRCALSFEATSPTADCGREWDENHLVSLSADPEHAVAVLLAEPRTRTRLRSTPAPPARHRPRRGGADLEHVTMVEDLRGQ